jgi:hypothetical protein
MLTEIDILRDICHRLDSLPVPYMLTGSMAMNYYAVPRMTRDIDLVIALPTASVSRLVKALTPDYMIVEEAVTSAVAEEFMFNAIHEQAVIKVDFVCRKNDAFRVLEFERRRKVAIEDFEVWIVSREDLILSKLHWSKDSRSEIQRQDIRNLLASECDRNYLREWAANLHLTSDLDSFLQ